MQRSGVTRELARFVVESCSSSIPAPIHHEAKRALLNWAGCALGGDQRAFIELAWSVDRLGDAGAFARAASPR